MKNYRVYNKILITGFIYYAAFVIWNILFKYVSPLELFSDERYFSRSLNFIPFSDLMKGNYNKLDVWGNMILFAPLGIFLKIWLQKKWYCLVPIAVVTSAAFEILQYIFAIGATDITDVVYNTFGFLSGIIVYSLLKFMLKTNEHIKILISVLTVIGVIFTVMVVALLFLFN